MNVGIRSFKYEKCLYYVYNNINSNNLIEFQDGDGEFESCGDLNIGKLCESSFIDWLSKNLNTVTYESIKEQVNLLKMIYQNIPTWLCNYAER